MKSSTTPRFWKAYRRLPGAVKTAAKNQYRIWREDPRHPSLHFKKVGPFWSLRVTQDYRGLAVERQGTYYWFWIGTHAEYQRLLRKE